MTPEEAETALQAWATVQRDELVWVARQAGVSKNRIHTITGIARTTIDRILETPVSTTQERLTEYLEEFTSGWPRPQPWEFRTWDSDYGYGTMATGIAHQYSATDVAGWLLQDAEFRALKLGTWLSTPDGEMVAAAVEALSPPPYRAEVTLLIEALQLAAKMQQAEAREKVVGIATVGALAGIVIAGARG